jgi:hypothetical protein
MVPQRLSHRKSNGEFQKGKHVKTRSDQNLPHGKILSNLSLHEAGTEWYLLRLGNLYATVRDLGSSAPEGSADSPCLLRLFCISTLHIRCVVRDLECLSDAGESLMPQYAHYFCQRHAYRPRGSSSSTPTIENPNPVHQLAPKTI